MVDPSSIIRVMDVLVTKKLDDFFEKYKTQKYKKGEILIRAGDDPTGIFYLKSGLVKKYAISRKGDELTVNIFKPFSFFPMSFAINHIQNLYFYEAMENLDVKKAPPQKVVDFIRENPEVMYDLLSRMYSGAEGLLSRITYLMAGNAYVKLIADLVVMGRRFGKKNGKEVILKTSEKDLSTHVGMTRETISREIKILKEHGLIEFERGKLIIKNMDKIEEELSQNI